MSVLPNFEYDLFISYSHVDNKPLTKGQRGWIDAFCEALQVRLAQVVSKNMRLFRDDPELAGNDRFESRLKNELRRTAFLVSIVSPSFLESDWCLDELRIFSAAEADERDWAGDKARIFKVVKWPVEIDDYPDPLRGLLGYEFFTWDEKGVPIELRPDFGEERWQQLFVQRLNDLALQIRRSVKELLETFHPEPGTVVRRVAPRGGHTVYLAQASYDLQEARDAIRRELEQRGHGVLPDGEIPLGPGLRDFVSGQLARAEMSIHPVGANYGLIPEAEDESIVELQYELAKQRGKQPGFERVVWLPRGLDLRADDGRQAEFVKRLRDGADLELLETSIEELKATVLEILDRPRPGPEAGVQGDGARPPRVYLVYDRQDAEGARELDDWLFSRGYDVLTPLMEGDEREVHEEHRQSLLTCDAVLIYCGEASERWLREQLREIDKAPGYGRAAPLRVQAVYMAPPRSDSKERFRSHTVQVLAGYDGFGPDSLTPFLEGLERTGPGT